MMIGLTLLLYLYFIPSFLNHLLCLGKKRILGILREKEDIKGNKVKILGWSGQVVMTNINNVKHSH